jgi:hypothetical protein
MSYSLDALDDGHIILFTMHQDFDMSVDMPDYLQQCYGLVDGGPDRIIVITDAREMKTKSFEDIIQGPNSVRSPEAQRLSRHSKVIKNLTVMTNKVAQLAMKGLNSASFGFLELTLFETQEEAIGYARKVLSDESKAN